MLCVEDRPDSDRKQHHIGQPQHQCESVGSVDHLPGPAAEPKRHSLDPNNSKELQAMKYTVVVKRSPVRSSAFQCVPQPRTTTFDA